MKIKATTILSSTAATSDRTRQPLSRAAGVSRSGCRVVREGTDLALHSPHFVFRLDTARGLRAVSWENRLAGRTLRLGNGHEFACDLDAAERRISIAGWKGIDSQPGHPAPNAERGYRAGFFRPEFDDSKWSGMLSPSLFWHHQDARYYWARTHLFLPADCARRELTLVLGGLGLFDFQFMRLFVNGHAVGVRRARKRWNEPGRFPLASRHLRFGQDNLIALQLAGYVTRTRRLDELDPQRSRKLPMRSCWPAQFEQYLVVGKASRPAAWSVARCRVERQGKKGEARFDLRAQKLELAARVTYRWSANQPTLHKFVEITNASSRETRLLSVRLGDYATAARVSEGEQGFPVYLDDQFFATLAHPAGWATGEDGRVRLRQFPGQRLAPGRTFRCMEMVLGVAPAGEARNGFLAHVRSRMRRVVRGHDKPLAIFEPFGSWPCQGFLSTEPTEAILLDNLRQVARGQKESGCHFDFYSIDFWCDSKGDLRRADPKRFRHQFDKLRRVLASLGTRPGLWIDSSMTYWSIGDNPVVQPTLTHDPAYGTERPTLCRATEPVRSMYAKAFRHHLRANGVRLVKFDNLSAICHNPHHNHLPGVYSTEAIMDGVIETLRELDAECPDVFLMLYWGHRSPWWLLDADTLFEPGVEIEAAHPGSSPTRFVRDSITQGLDQAQWWCKDVPPLGKDSLGVWLSDWGWNSSVGRERWQEAFVMDMCRGSLLAQPWSDQRWLNPPQRQRMAEFIALLKAAPGCFANPRFILGNPWRDEPYGYCCTDGERTFLALNNCCWKDSVVDVASIVSARSGPPLAHARSHDVYRWHPKPARLTGDTTRIALRPFEVVLLEIVPAGRAPSLPRRFATAPMPRAFREPTCRIKPGISVPRRTVPLRLPIENEPKKPLPPKRVLRVTGQTPVSRRGGELVVTARLRRGSTACLLKNTGSYFAAEGTLARRRATWTPVVREQTYPAAWQAWRAHARAADKDLAWELTVTAGLPHDVRIAWDCYFVPDATG